MTVAFAPGLATIPGVKSATLSISYAGGTQLADLKKVNYVVLGGQNAGERREGEVEGEVPRRDDADDTQRLVVDLRLGAKPAEDCRCRLALFDAHPLS